jgi:glucose-6-phosphate 1-epimerase
VAVKWQQSVRNGLDVLDLATAASTCSVALHGAQVLSFAPRGERDWLWVSEKARWKVGAALRGGIPICFPWFGPHPTNRGFPAHGFARTRAWRLLAVDELAGARVRAVLELGDDDTTLALFPCAFTARTTVIAGDDLELSFEVVNRGSGPLGFEAALHTYFAVSDSEAITVEGLGGHTYVDKVSGAERCLQGAEPLRISGEVDRVYQTGGPVTLADPAGARSLRLETRGAASTVVWNPGSKKAAALTDLSPDSFRRFVCLETGNIGDQRITVPAGGSHAMSVRVLCVRNRT